MNLVKINSINIWDEEWEQGAYNSSTGAKSGWVNAIRAKNQISVSPSTEYFLKWGTTSRIYVLFYDLNGTFISSDYRDVQSYITTPSNCYYMAFNTRNDYGTTYNHDIQICLNTESEKTTYHPHWVLGLDKQGRAMTVEPSAVLPSWCGVVDFGECTWYYASNIQAFYTLDLRTEIKKTSSDAEIASWLISNLYDASSVNNISVSLMDMKVSVNGSGNIYVSNHTYTDVSTFKSAMNGVLLFYKKATT